MAGSEYADVLAALYRLEAAKGMDFKLERVALALKNLGNPQRDFAAIHVAGTNGKGSVAAMLQAMFDAGGYRAGLYTSPHLLRFTERVRIGNQEITQDAVVGLAREIHAAATLRGIELTFFEFVTVMAFLHFARERIDLAVIEVGLGGRLDATNVIDPAVTVITTIGLDHQEFLGDTLASIAAEKAGIVKPQRPLVVGRLGPEAARIVMQAAATENAPAVWLGRDFAVQGNETVAFEGLGRPIDGLSIGLQGSYQHDNAATAVAAALCMGGDFPLTDGAIRQGLSAVHWPGRLQVVRQQPLVVLDGAHNLDGVTALVHELPAIVGARRVHVLFAVMRDKSWRPMVDAIAPHAASVTVTTVLPPRGAAAAELAAAFKGYCPVRIAETPADGITVLLREVDPGDAIVVCGSLFLVGAVCPCFPSDTRSDVGARPTAAPQP